MEIFKVFEEKIEYCNQLIKMVDGVLDDENNNVVYQDIMITARLGLLRQKHDLETDLFMKKMSLKSRDEHKIKENLDTLKAQSEALFKRFKP